MGDHHGFVDPKHGGDEPPIHKVRVDSFKIGVDAVTTAQYCGFLNSAFRAYRYGADHPAFKGHELSPNGTITERAAQGVDVYPKRRPPGDRPQGKGDSQGGRRAGDVSDRRQSLARRAR